MIEPAMTSPITTERRSPLPHTIHPVRSPVLSNICTSSGSQPDAGTVQQAVQLIGSCAARYYNIIIGVNHPLRDHPSGHHDDIGQCQRYSKPQKRLDHSSVRLPVRPAQTKNFHFQDHAETVCKRQYLRHERGKSRSDNSHAKACDKQKIQQDIAGPRDQHGNQRGLAIPHRAQKCRRQIIGHDNQRSGIHCRQICLCPSDYILRSPEQPQKRRSPAHRGGRQNRPKNPRQ